MIKNQKKRLKDQVLIQEKNDRGKRIKKRMTKGHEQNQDRDLNCPKLFYSFLLKNAQILNINQGTARKSVLSISHQFEFNVSSPNGKETSFNFRCRMKCTSGGKGMKFISSLTGISRKNLTSFTENFDHSVEDYDAYIQILTYL